MDAYGGGFYPEDRGGHGGFATGSSPSHTGYAARTGTDVSPAGKRIARDRKALFPVTLRQITSFVRSPAGDGWCMPEGSEVSLVRFVGRVVEAAHADMRSDLKVSDGTGELTLSHYFDPDDVFWAQMRGTLKAGVYVEVVGQVKLQGTLDRPAITPVDIRFVSDSNAITHHFLSVIQTYAVLVKGPLAASAAPAAPVGGLGGFGLSTMQTAGSFGLPGAALSLGGVPAGGQGAEAQIIAVLRGVPSAAPDADGDGISEAEIVSLMASRGMPAAAVTSALRDMINNGALYTTVDEFHYHLTA